MITFLELYNEVAGQPWSMFDADAESIDDLESSLKTSINKAASKLWNMQPWSFRVQDMKTRLTAGKNRISMPNGKLMKESLNNKTTYGIKCNGVQLEYITDPDALEEKTGVPEGFYLKGENIYFYPTADNTYSIELTYLLLPYALTEDEEEIYELKEETDMLNIPDKYSALFRNCLISLAMIYAIADESDENHSGYQRQYEDALATLMDYCNTPLMDRNLFW